MSDRTWHHGMADSLERVLESRLWSKGLTAFVRGVIFGLRYEPNPDGRRG